MADNQNVQQLTIYNDTDKFINMRAFFRTQNSDLSVNNIRGCVKIQFHRIEPGETKSILISKPYTGGEIVPINELSINLNLECTRHPNQYGMIPIEIESLNYINEDEYSGYVEYSYEDTIVVSEFLKNL